MRFTSAVGRGLRRAGSITARVIPPLARGLVGIAGACAIVYGVWQIHQPAAWIVAGVILVLVALRLAGGGASISEVE
jgi:hypothetical protein